ncbi:hypothetical protein BOTBODRAFT_403572 [Botryobasidium botryosum FD-172 SS1]|uniref:Uncharacterized protein n=1 Tax=Botryobasidium botryosum (strain FD-172 SS1) TaxID=930990 RepID=A0A067MMS2_BOTB1|nr:hypothetical protein BOTBODRAFT_403572 [Botryobasidium botryosum FD-172 SS1]
MAAPSSPIFDGKTDKFTTEHELNNSASTDAQEDKPKLPGRERYAAKIRDLVQAFLKSHFSERRQLVHFRFFILVILAMIAIAILVCAWIIWSIPYDKDWHHPRTIYSTIAVTSFALLVHTITLLFVPPLWMEIFISLLMTGTSIWLLVEWIMVRRHLLHPWLNGAQISATFSLWPLLGIYAILWSLATLALLLFASNYAKPSAKIPTNQTSTGQTPTDRTPTERWKYTAHEPIWAYEVCDIPAWEDNGASNTSQGNASIVLKEHPVGRWSFNFWRTSDNNLLPLLMFKPLELLPKQKYPEEHLPTHVEPKQPAAHSEKEPYTPPEGRQKHTHRIRPKPTKQSSFRGIMLIAFVVAFIFYLEESLFIESFRESSAHATQTYYGDLNSDISQSLLSTSILTVIIGFKSAHIPAGVELSSAVNVTAIWSSDYSLPIYPECDIRPDNTLARLPQRTFVRATCPMISSDMEGAPLACRNDPGYSPCRPDFLITFDYSVLGTPPQERTLAAFSASVWTGFAPENIDLTDITVSIALLNNVHLVGSWARNVRRRFHIGSPVPSFMGMFQSF